MITERQEKILTRLVQDYIDLAHPISSEFMEKKHNFGLSPATLRIELQKLTEQGFLYQPHTSAGRAPTDKGYRFFVNEVFEKGFSKSCRDGLLSEITGIKKEFKDASVLFQAITKRIAKLTSELVISYLPEEEVFFKEGWSSVLREPEFGEADYVSKLAGILDELEEKIGVFEDSTGIKVYIGRENPISEAEDFSMIVSNCCLKEDQKGLLAVFGPKRMAYKKNIGILDSITKIFEEL